MDAIRIIKERWPDMHAALCSSGTHPDSTIEVNAKRKIIKLGSVSLCSAINPAKEAERIVHNEGLSGFEKHINIIGHGFGDLLHEVLQTTAEKIDLHIPHNGLFREALQYWTYPDDMTDPRLRIILANCYPDEIDQQKLATTRLIELPGLKRTMPEFIATRRVALGMRRAAGIKLKILVVQPLYGGSLPVSRSVASAFRQIGHDVYEMSYSGMEEAHNTLLSFDDRHNCNTTIVKEFGQLLGKMLHAEVMRFKPDLVFALAQSPATVEAIELIRSTGVKTAYWFVEDFETLEYWKALHGHFDLFLTIQKGRCLEEMRKCSDAPLRYLPMCADPEICFADSWSDETESKPAISFVGAGYHNRERMFLELIDKDLKIWGSDWRKQHPTYEMVQNNGNRTDSTLNREIFSNSQINLNLHSSTYHTGINPLGDFVNPRTFEILACGGFQMVDKRSLLNELLTPGKDLISYSDTNELRDLIEYYMEHHEERELISKTGKATVLRQHTYKVRMAECLEMLVINGVEFFPFAQQVKDDELDQVDDSRLRGYLKELPADIPHEIAAIANHVKSKGGERLEEESLFLFMHEIREWARVKRIQVLAEKNQSV
jgi:spore maturation protein CgeB